jgi:hypothetical protein
MRALTGLISLLFLVGMIGAAHCQAVPFVAEDFSVQIESQQQSFRPGEVVVFDAILTNLSSQVADFGTNVALTGVSSGTEIDGVFVLAYPFIEGYEVHGFSNQPILPGGSIRFPLLFVDTGTTTPLGTTIVSGGGNLLFENIPKSTGGLFVDFFTPFSNLATSVAVPEPGSLLLATSLGALFGCGLARRR